MYEKESLQKNTNPLYGFFFMPNPGPEGYREHNYRETNQSIIHIL